MSAGTNAFAAKGGFNQSGGAYFMTLAALEPDVTSLTNSFINTITAAGSNSGGAFSNASFTKVSMSSIVGGSNTNGASTLVGANKMLKDMGRTVVSAGRTFRKFAPVLANSPSSFGVTGSAATTLTTGYASFYLEVGRETGVPAPIARYF